MDLSEIIRMAKAYTELGWAVQGQLDSLLDGDTDQNPNAIKLIERFAAHLPDEPKEELTGLIAGFREANKD